MIYVIDNEKFLDKKYHFNIVEPFSENVNYKIILLNDFENYISHLVDVLNINLVTDFYNKKNSQDDLFKK
jgi:hypothetical protein